MLERIRAKNTLAKHTHDHQALTTCTTEGVHGEGSSVAEGSALCRATQQWSRLGSGGSVRPLQDPEDRRAGGAQPDARPYPHHCLVPSSCDAVTALVKRCGTHGRSEHRPQGRTYQLISGSPKADWCKPRTGLWFRSDTAVSGLIRAPSQGRTTTPMRRTGSSVSSIS